MRDSNAVIARKISLLRANTRTLLLNLYRIISWMLYPVSFLFLQNRLRSGKETVASVSQKMGRYIFPRPHGALLWIHAASVGETKSVLPLIAHIKQLRPKLNILLTTITLGASKYLENHPSDQFIHQALALDVPPSVDRFWNHWLPDVGILIDSELWPNLLAYEGCPMLCLNARISLRSYKRWCWARTSFCSMMGRFDWIVPTTPQDSTLLTKLCVVRDNMLPPRNLKDIAPPLACDESVLKQLQEVFPTPNAIFASTHKGEEQQILTQFSGSMVNIIIAPRHEHRANEIAEIGHKLGYQVHKRSDGIYPSPLLNQPLLYIVDKIGELGLWYRLAQLVFVGGSLVRIGGHNVIEAAQLGKAIVVGPYTSNFSAAIEQLERQKAIVTVADATELKQKILHLLSDPIERQKLEHAAETAFACSDDMMDFYAELILPMLTTALCETKN